MLGEVEEVDEDSVSTRKPSIRRARADTASEAGSSEHAHEPFEYAWLDPHSEVEMERNALREDVDLWRKRCNGLEERLDLEKKENGILRERVRKREWLQRFSINVLTTSRRPAVCDGFLSRYEERYISRR